MKNQLRFRNIYSQKELIINDYQDYSQEELIIILQRESNSPIYQSSLSHLLKGRRKFIGEWKIESDIPSDGKKFNKSGRKINKMNNPSFSQLSPSEKINNMRIQREEMRKNGNRRGFQILDEMIKSWESKSIRGKEGDDLSRLDKRIYPIINPKFMNIKIGKEKYDSRIKNFI